MDEQVKPAEAWKRVLSSYKAWERDEVDSSIYVMEALAAYLNTSRRQPAASPSPEGTRERGELVARLKNDLAQGWISNARTAADIRALLALVSPLEGKGQGSSSASLPAHVASATATEATCDLETVNFQFGGGLQVVGSREAIDHLVGWYDALKALAPVAYVMDDLADKNTVISIPGPAKGHRQLLPGPKRRDFLNAQRIVSKQCAALQSSAKASVAAAERSEAGCAGTPATDAPSLPDSSCKSEGTS